VTIWTKCVCFLKWVPQYLIPHSICCSCFMFLTEIPGFLSEEECRVVVQLAQLKGLTDSPTAAPSQGQEDSNQPLLSLSTEEVFSLLDLNQDGLLQKQEVTTKKHWISHVAPGEKQISLKKKNFVVFPPDCEPFSLSRWNLVEPRQLTADTDGSGSLPYRSVLLRYI